MPISGRCHRQPLETIRSSLARSRSATSELGGARHNATLGLARQRLGQNPQFDRMERDTEILNDMIDRILAVARLDTIAASPARRATDLDVLVSEVVADAQLEASHRNCRVALACDGACRAEIDPDLVRSAAKTSSGTPFGIRHLGPPWMFTSHASNGPTAIRPSSWCPIADRACRPMS
jgi:signal transduction histidine kinase